MGSLRSAHDSKIVNDYAAHRSAKRVSTDVPLARLLHAHYPRMILSVVPFHACDLRGFVNAGHATFNQDATAESYFRTRCQPYMDDGSSIREDVLVKYKHTWKGQDLSSTTLKCQNFADWTKYRASS